MAKPLPPHLQLWELTASMILLAEAAPAWRKFTSAVSRHAGLNVTRRVWGDSTRYLDYPMPYPEWVSYALDDPSWNLRAAQGAAQDFAHRVGIAGGVDGMVEYWRQWRRLQGWPVGEDLIDTYEGI